MADVDSERSGSSFRPLERESRGQRMIAWLVLLAVVTALMYPWIVWGISRGHDQDTHLYYFHAFNSQFRSGELYPRWLASLNAGAGSPIFFLQYPLPFFLASVIHRGLALPDTPAGESHALGLVFLLEAWFFATAAFLWASHFLKSGQAALVALLGLTLPYVLWIDFYTRVALGECMALGCMLLLLYFSEFLSSRPVVAIAGLGIGFGLLFLSHVLSIVMFTPFLLAYILLRNPERRLVSSAVCAFAGGCLGAGLAAVYLLPLATHRRYFHAAGFNNQPGGIMSVETNLFPLNTTVTGHFPSGWWLLNWIIRAFVFVAIAVGVWKWPKLRGLPFLRRAIVILSVLAILAIVASPLVLGGVSVAANDPIAAEIASFRSHMFGFAFLSLEVAVCAFLALELFEEKKSVWLLAACLVTFLLTTRVTAPFWSHSSFLRDIQFPWRFLGEFSLLLVGLIVLVLRPKQGAALPGKHRVALLLAFFAPLSLLAAVAWQGPERFRHLLPDKPAQSADLALPTYADTEKLFGHLTPWPGGSTIGTRVLSGSGRVELQSISPRERRLSADCSSPCAIQLNLMFFPLWSAVESDSGPVKIDSNRENGLAVLRLQPGAHEIRLQLPKDRMERVGPWVSLVSGLLICVLFLFAAVQSSPR